MIASVEETWASNGSSKVRADAEHESPDSVNLEVMPGVAWGARRTHGTPANRLMTIGFSRQLGPKLPTAPELTLGQSVGRYFFGGLTNDPCENAAFERLDSLGAFGVTAPTPAQLIEWLSQPLTDRRGQVKALAFTDSQAEVVSHCLAAVAADNHPRDPTSLRNWLLQLPRVNHYAASWIVKFALEPDCIALVDEYLLMNGQVMGLYPLDAVIERDYFWLEERFITLCHRMGVHPWEFQNELIMDFVIEAEELEHRHAALRARAPA